ncbi:hypothetical protein CBZ_07380 [Cellulomonas biazotea]|uniref:Uncharacterized protein n=1 Tax=Cellulomonas biazotea TaxID=1709 RepID=A0A402DNF7_9CELL|nr:hypothetical protein CBZ_07380 [Cellulomonas biazotea]
MPQDDEARVVGDETEDGGVADDGVDGGEDDEGQGCGHGDGSLMLGRLLGRGGRVPPYTLTGMILTI